MQINELEICAVVFHWIREFFFITKVQLQQRLFYFTVIYSVNIITKIMISLFKLMALLFNRLCQIKWKKWNMFIVCVTFFGARVKCQWDKLLNALKLTNSRWAKVTCPLHIAQGTKWHLQYYHVAHSNNNTHFILKKRCDYILKILAVMFYNWITIIYYIFFLQFLSTQHTFTLQYQYIFKKCKHLR